MTFILASASPRRLELLLPFELDIKVIPSHIEEHTRESESPIQIVMGLSFAKAMSLAHHYPDKVIIACDTIVYLDHVFGKPKDKQDAYNMLKYLSGKEHKVYSGMALIHLASGKKIVDYEETSVLFHHLSDDEIWRYIHTGEPDDKAGAYGIQGLGAVFVSKIEGDYYNVMGLPLSKLHQMLKKHFDFSLI